MILKNCDKCVVEFKMFACRLKHSKSGKYFCSKSCATSYRNTVANPSLYRDLKGINNPMYGKHPIAWNKGLIGQNCHNWKGGIHQREDGYVRINVKGTRKLLHRHILQDKLKANNVVHHIDHNPSNNEINNLMVFESQSEHVKYEHQ